MKQDMTDGVFHKAEGIFQGLMVTKGNAYTFLGMKIRHLNNNRVAIHIKGYILEAIQKFGEDVSQMVMSPTARWLFTVSKVREI